MVSCKDRGESSPPSINPIFLNAIRGIFSIEPDDEPEAKPKTYAPLKRMTAIECLRVLIPYLEHIDKKLGGVPFFVQDACEDALSIIEDEDKEQK